ncbi:MAG: hypothetical protein AABO41_18560 [Acidobacteriota bacterium]
MKDTTGSLSLISQERLDGRFVTRMQNTSNKAITAYGTAVCDAPESSTDYSIGDDLIEPGEVVDIDTSIRAVSHMCGSKITRPTLTILAVVFDDRTYAGEFQWAKGILDDRRGQKIQLKRINRLLANASKWPDASQSAALEILKGEIRALPIDEAETPAVRGGLSSAKQRALYLLDELKLWHQGSLTAQSRRNIPIQGELAGIDSLPEGIEKLITLNKKWISRY